LTLAILPGNPTAEAFRQRLRELGYVEGQNLTIDWRSSEGRLDTLDTLAAELVRLHPAVLFAGGSTEAALAAQRATDSIPIVFAISDDPVGVGLVQSLAHPGGNVTGLWSLNAEVEAKRVELLKEAIPTLSRVAVLSSPNEPTAHILMRAAETAAQVAGLQLQFLDAPDPGVALEAAFQTAVNGRSEALLVQGFPRFLAYSPRIAELATMHRLPAIGANRQLPRAGGLASYGSDAEDSFRRVAEYVDKLLRGAKPADLPVERPTTVDFVINLGAAKALGLSIPASVLAQATEVIS
jgi:putative ABC transport system substrate-binding protein